MTVFLFSNEKNINLSEEVKEFERQSIEKVNENNEISLMNVNNASGVNAHLSNILNKTEDEKLSEGNVSEIDKDTSIQKMVAAKVEPKNEYLARLEFAKQEKKKEKTSTNKNQGNMMGKEKEKEIPESPIKPTQKITISKNAMKGRDTNKIDYGVSGVDEGFLYIFFKL